MVAVRARDDVRLLVREYEGDERRPVEQGRWLWPVSFVIDGVFFAVLHVFWCLFLRMHD